MKNLTKLLIVFLTILFLYLGICLFLFSIENQKQVYVKNLLNITLDMNATKLINGLNENYTRTIDSIKNLS